MQYEIVAAIFGTPLAAERAIAELRNAGVKDELISFVTSAKSQENKEDGTEAGAPSLDHDSRSTGVLKGVGAGGAVGALAGLVALAIPGLMPFIAAGAIAELGVAGSAAVVSGVVGASAGGMTAILIDYGIGERDAEHIDRRLKEGAALVAVDTRQFDWDHSAVRAVLRAAGGEIAEPEPAAPASATGSADSLLR